jgi:hypothetical protein
MVIDMEIDMAGDIARDMSMDMVVGDVRMRARKSDFHVTANESARLVRQGSRGEEPADSARRVGGPNSPRLVGDEAKRITS